MLRDVLFVFTRFESCTIGTAAILHVKVDEGRFPGCYKHLNPDAVLESLKEALSEWALTREGRREYVESCEDFNVGDLLMLDFDNLDPKLNLALVSHGIYQLSGESMTETAIRNFDEVLMHPEELTI